MLDTHESLVRLHVVAASLLLSSLLCPALHADQADEPTEGMSPGGHGAADGGSAATPAPPQPGEEPRYRLDPVVVTAERLPMPLRRLPFDVSVIGSDRLDAARPLFLADALREVPSLDVQRSGSLGKLTDVRLRGADPRHTLVLYEGTVLNGPWLGTFDFADLGGFGWSQVEVVGGPSSSLYGSGAVGGVIQILPAAPGALPVRRAFVEYGEDRTLRQGAAWAGRAGTAGITAAASRLTSRGITARDAYRGHSGHARLEAPLTTPLGAADVRVGVMAFDARKDLPFDFIYDATDSRFHQILDPDNEEADRLLLASTTVGLAASERVRIEGESSMLSARIENRNEPGGSTGDYLRSDLANTRTVAGMRGHVRFPSAGHLLVGAEWRRETADLSSDFSGFESDVDEAIESRGLYAQGHAEAGAGFLLDAGVRVEDHPRYGAHSAPRLAVGYDVRKAGLKLRAGFGRAFTSPSLTDLYYPFYGNPGLRPERSQTYEAGADGRWLAGGIECHVTWHSTRFKDLVQAGSFVVENIGRARIDGGELRVRWAPRPGLALTSWTAHLRTRNETTGARLPKRPRWRHGASLEASPTHGSRVTASWRWSDSRIDPFPFVDASGRFLDGDAPGYATVDLDAHVSLKPWAPLSARVGLANVLDREYSEVKGFPARGRAAIVGIELRPW